MDTITRFIESLKTRRIKKPTIAAIGTTLFSNVLAIVVLSTDYWEKTEFYGLETISILIRNDSMLDDKNGFYSLKLQRTDKQYSIGGTAVDPVSALNPNINSNNNVDKTTKDSGDNTLINDLNNNNTIDKQRTDSTTGTTGTTVTTVTVPTTTVPPVKVQNIQVILRARRGGIWQICDRISDEFKSNNPYFEAVVVKQYPSFKNPCYSYIKDYEKSNMTDKGIAIIRMQNSAVSCVIVSILCMITSLVTGAFSIWREQVAVCMVTGVLNCVSGTFLCFALTIMTTKFKYMSGDCLTIDGSIPKEVCQKTSVQMSWSMALGWFSLLVIIWKAIMWLYLSRCYRLEKSKSIV